MLVSFARRFDSPAVPVRDGEGLARSEPPSYPALDGLTGDCAVAVDLNDRLFADDLTRSAIEPSQIV